MSNPVPQQGYLAQAPVPPPADQGRAYSLPSRIVTLALAAVGSIGLVIAALWPVSSVDNGQSTCLLQMTTGLPCPGCGMTRSWVHLAHGDISGAFAYNAFGPLVMAATVAVVGYTAWALLRRRPPERFFDLIRPRPVLVLVGAWLAYSTWRIVSLSLGYDTFALVVS
ncbi:hypothetical protein GCM10027055_15760 [Janibacter alkaliphilus]|uniref:DUF2752 domain-containing protein n=1 Tax=Janibacter alkaliphilus TaxID=1069963 RepID=A0A852X9L4_9MICO|nr:DUF2752 domain-containing protein [Janibacter alkaliphilus]NYG37433.1 hypothetical protein [Janibacter alkaliphilus]